MKTREPNDAGELHARKAGTCSSEEGGRKSVKKNGNSPASYPTPSHGSQAGTCRRNGYRCLYPMSSGKAQLSGEASIGPSP